MLGKKLSLSLAAVVLVGALGYSLFSWGQQYKSQAGSVAREYIAEDLIGTASASSTLTATYTDNAATSTYTKFMENLHLDIEYRPQQASRYAYVLIEVSNDEGTTWFPVGTKVIGTTQTDLHIQDLDGNDGSPIIIPGDKTSTAGAIHRGAIDMDIVADSFRIFAKESGSSAFGGLYVRGTLSSK